MVPRHSRPARNRASRHGMPPLAVELAGLVAQGLRRARFDRRGRTGASLYVRLAGRCPAFPAEIPVRTSVSAAGDGRRGFAVQLDDSGGEEGEGTEGGGGGDQEFGSDGPV